jgi:anaerobic selenocysteine-containing dehydrogenase
MKSARRNFLLFGGGATAGLVFSPAPWKLLDDVSIWTQNWSWTPEPPRGEITVRHTVCTLCPAACAVRARCVGDQPVGLAGVPDHPVSRGRLCAGGFGAHQLPYHPQRVTEFRRNGSAATKDAAVQAVAQRLGRESKVAVLDLQPGRAASVAHAKFASQWTGGVYATLPSPSFGLEIEKAKTIVSFGAPLLERWSSPGRFLDVWTSPGRPKLIQIEASQSRTAALADEWIPARAGTAGVLGRALLGGGDRTRAAQLAGIALETLDAIERAIVQDGPTLVVSAGKFTPEEESAIVSLNFRSATPLLVKRASSPVEVPAATSFDAIEDASLDVLFVDHGPAAASIGPERLSRKMKRDGLVVSFSPYAAGDAAKAGVFVPTPAWLESGDDAVEPWDASVPSYTIAPALAKAAAGSTESTVFLAEVAKAAGVEPPQGREETMRARIAALHASRKGEVFAFADGKRTLVKEFESPDKLWEAFQAGACWTGDAPSPLAKDAIAGVTSGTAVPAVEAPLTSKLYRESRLFTRSA